MDTDRARQHAVGDIPRRTAARYAHKTAIIDGATTLTFAEFDQAVNRVANALLERGLRKGDRCAILSRNRWEYAVLSFATARIGVILVPINFMLNAEEVAYILEHSGAATVVAEAGLAETADGAIALQSGDVRRIMLDGNDGHRDWEPFAELLSAPDTAPPFVSISDDDPVRLMYTSGTESRPKGALLSSRALMWEYVSCAIDGGMSHDDVELHALPLYHCAQLDCFLGPDIYLGATSIITAGPDPETVLALIEKHGVTKFFAPPTVWISLLRSPAFDTTDLSTLAKGYYGASAMPVEVLREIAERLPNVRLWNFYGQTEMSPVATILAPHEQLTHAGSAGRPVLNVETFVVDEHGEPLPAGEVGEIVHRSPHATLGYYNDPEKTAEAFAGGFFHSGDLGVFDEHGLLRVVDRKKDMIKTGGENVASREVEEAIYLHPGVAEVAVFGVADPKWVEAVAAVVVPRDGVALTDQEVVEHCRARLAGYKTPKHVVLAASLPKNPSGKILKRVLREEFETSRKSTA
ncbi:acyl-CoA synthetase [[Mycobacterium] wendilense]|uniref:Acyl-CoA synthetase n=1 Tax=[Mycobacterium] wendilense TaxID=3064284 RepID=A0ABM9MDC6_9MYCO|nr:acyl-CoA synthetase [Mycolicibacterium sp. MU0050]CAJ1582427.1 acyl-CoA synthetase [Mycolicibacterium sp. MU0050]